MTLLNEEIFYWFYSQMRLIYYIDKDEDEDEWNCSCYYFMQYSYYKYMVRFKKGILKMLVPPKYDMRNLTPYKRRGRAKTVPDRYISIPAASMSEINTGEISADESEFSDSIIILNEFDVKGDIVV